METAWSSETLVSYHRLPGVTVLHPEEGGGMGLRNVGILPHHKASPYFALKMEGVWTSKTLVSYHNIQSVTMLRSEDGGGMDL
jgi:hypothetical protein